MTWPWLVIFAALCGGGTVWVMNSVFKCIRYYALLLNPLITVLFSFKIALFWGWPFSRQVFHPAISTHAYAFVLMATGISFLVTALVVCLKADS